MRNTISHKGIVLLFAALACGAALRLTMIHLWPQIAGDSLMYGDIAKNWLHGTYGVTAGGVVHPTLIRLPGYPAFLALCFRIFGMEHYMEILWLQAAIDLVSCLLLAGFVRRIAGSRAAWIALWLACLCPFTANYTASALTETLTIFCISLGLYATACYRENPGWISFLGLTFSFAYGTLLRPDGALLALALWPLLLFLAGKQPMAALRIRIIGHAAACALLCLLPFAVWAWRNWTVFHVFEPLAPRYATDPDENPGHGFQQWTKTWLVDFTSTSDVYWNVPGDVLSTTKLPARAFDSPQQRSQTEQIFADYNATQVITAEVDSRFTELARERIRNHPWRYHIVLPMARLADMWLRPRVEALPFELDWWNYRRHAQETVLCLLYAGLNLLLILAALAGIRRWPPFTVAMLAYMLLRSLLLLTIEAPETRYTLECIPLLIALAAANWSRRATDSGALLPMRP